MKIYEEVLQNYTFEEAILLEGKELTVQYDKKEFKGKVDAVHFPMVNTENWGLVMCNIDENENEIWKHIKLHRIDSIEVKKGATK